jgi:hypothetical protein
MLAALGRRSADPASPRTLKLFALSCCRLGWPALTDVRSRRALDVAERFLGGFATEEELARAVTEADAARDEAVAAYEATNAVELLGSRQALTAAAFVVAHGFDQFIFAKIRDALAFRGVLRDRGSLLALVQDFGRNLRDIFGDPFRPVAFDPAWRTSEAVALARQVYESRDFGAMPILADALQDAGCDCEEVLGHCRDASATHVRGCWVVDLVLVEARRPG